MGKHKSEDYKKTAVEYCFSAKMTIKKIAI